GRRFFFFQAEDGIRVFHVTGVQTCALPIPTTGAGLLECRDQFGQASTGGGRYGNNWEFGKGGAGDGLARLLLDEIEPVLVYEVEIGRASCRERVWLCVRGEVGSAQGMGVCG